MVPDAGAKDAKQWIGHCARFGRRPNASPWARTFWARHGLFCGTDDGIACILGTGSNSGLYVGGKLVANVSPLGYILGDEGSGAVLGRRLLGDVLKRQLPQDVCLAFEKRYGLSADAIIQRVYREPMANRFLASFAPFLAAHREHPAIRALLADEFARF